MIKHTMSCLLVAATGTLTTGCAGRNTPPVLSDTRLGSVIIYRNGVAYFERQAPADEKEISLRVPAERVDDFLKSLSIVDQSNGKALAVSYPTLDSYEGYVAMTLALPQRHGPLKISYVTESSAWKPSYRVVLGKGKAARLQGWAVIDNVSGEDWDKVRVGVGSTSALSFRYDLHSVRLVEREILSSGAALAYAPPTGGSPYAVAKRKVRVLSNIDAEQLAQLGGGGGIAAGKRGKVSEETIALPADGPMAEMDTDDGGSIGTTRQARRAATKKGVRARRFDAHYFRSLSKRLQAGNHRVRIEGYAQAGDDDRKRASLARANAVRDKLVALGMPAKNIDAVGTGAMNAQQAVRVLETEDEITGGAGGARGEPLQARDTQPVGQAHFLSKHAMSIEADHSAMVSILNEPTRAERVYFYDPVSARGSKRYAFNAVRLHNPSPYTLAGGPFTVYADRQFLGEGLADPILPNADAFIPYALDRSIIVEPAEDTRERIERLITIERGIVSTESRRIRRTKLNLSNRGRRKAHIFVRHLVAQGFELDKGSKAKTAKLEKLGGAYLFPVEVAPGEAVQLVIEEWTPLMKTVDIRTDGGMKQIAVYLKTGRLEPTIAAKLGAILRAHTDSADLAQRIELLADQTRVYRQRVDELNVQLVTLRKVPQAARLRRHLSKKMEEISNKLQQATMEMTDLKGKEMTLRIDLQDKLAELRLAPKTAADHDGDPQLATK